MIKIGTIGWNRDAQACCVRTAQVSYNLLWCEIDGHRIDSDRLRSVSMRFEISEFSTVVVEVSAGFNEAPEWASEIDGVEIDLLAVPAIVICDRDGKPLPWDCGGHYEQG